MSVCVCGRVNVHYNVHQHVEYIYVYIWPHIQKHTTESFIQRSIQYWCLWILDIPTITKIEPSIFITLIDIIYYQNPRKLSCVFFLSRTRFALKDAFKRLYLALIAGIFIIILIKRKVHLPVNKGMLSTDALLIHAVTTVYFQYPTRREHWPQ